VSCKPATITAISHHTCMLSHTTYCMSYDKVQRTTSRLHDFTTYDFTTFTTLRLLIDLETHFCTINSVIILSITVTVASAATLRLGACSFVAQRDIERYRSVDYYRMHFFHLYRAQELTYTCDTSACVTGSQLCSHTSYTSNHVSS
jgi:hypothetical protein